MNAGSWPRGHADQKTATLDLKMVDTWEVLARSREKMLDVRARVVDAK
jgi:hypothetical protein